MLFRLTILLASIAAAGSAHAADAQCYTTDDGDYPCNFQGLDGDGSFEISAPGRPTFMLTMDGPGVAFGAAVFEQGGRSVALPGLFLRSEDDGACWVNDTTGTEICAW